MILAAAFIASLIPALIMFLWLRRQPGTPEGYKDHCKKAVIAGCISVLPAVACSAALHLIGILLHLKSAGPILFAAYYSFFVLAFSEELMKFLMMRRTIRNQNVSWFETTVYMCLTGLGFEVLEAVPYAIGSGVPHMLVRGFTLMHVAFGFITGYFYGKARYTGKKGIFFGGFLLSWILHGTYDFCLSEDVMNANDNFGLLALAIAALSVILIFMIIRFVRKAGNSEKYMCATEVLHK